MNKEPIIEPIKEPITEPIKEPNTEIDREDKKSLTYYQHDGARIINKFLRDFTDYEKILDHMKRIDHSLTNSYEGIMVYRGIPNMERLLTATNEAGFDHTFIDHGYSSTSTNLCTASRFTHTTCCVLSFVIPRGIRGFSFREKENDFNNMREDEIVLERDLQYFFTEPTMLNGIKVYPCIVKKYISLVTKDDLHLATKHVQAIQALDKKIREQSIEEIVTIILEEYKKISLVPSQENSLFFYDIYYKLCLDRDRESLVYDHFSTFFTDAPQTKTK